MCGVSMAEIKLSASIVVTGGPTVSLTQTPIQAEATERIEVTIAAGAPEKTVTLQPGTGASIHLITIKSNTYGDGTNISLKVSDGTTDSAAIDLSGPQIYSGGAVAWFGVDPNLLKFTNASASDANIEIFVARDATP